MRRIENGPGMAATIPRPDEKNALRVCVRVSTHTTLVNVPDAVKESIKNTLTLRNPKYDEAVRRNRWLGKIPEILEFYEDCSEEGLSIPRGFTKAALGMLRQAGIQPIIDDQRLTLPPVKFEFRGELRPYQEKAVAAVIAYDHGVLESGTGSGKTTMALHIIAARQQPTLVIVHNRELLYQWAERARQFLGVDVGLVGDGRFELAPLTIGIVNSVRKRLDDLTGHFGQVICDECHRTPSATFQVCVAAFPARFLLGLSATPFRRDGLDKLIFWALGNLVHCVDQAVLLKSGAILRPQVIQKETNFRFKYRDNYAEMVTALCEDQERNELLIRDVIENLKGGTTLIVSDRVAHCRRLAEMLHTRGIPSVVLIGADRRKQRIKAVEAVQAGKTPVLISTLSLISEGFDCSGLDRLFLATPVRFKGRILQTVGRILRPAPGKTAMVFDYCDVKIPVLRQQAKKRWEA